jgi:hypothetical protein
VVARLSPETELCCHGPTASGASVNQQSQKEQDFFNSLPDEVDDGVREVFQRRGSASHGNLQLLWQGMHSVLLSMLAMDARMQASELIDVREAMPVE